MLGAATDPCGEHGRVWLCHWVSNISDNRTAMDTARYLSPFVSVLLIALLALVVAWISRRLIRRAVRRWERFGSHQGWRKRVPLRVATEPDNPIEQARRRQRSETIGAGLSSFSTILIWVVAIVWMLSVLGVKAATLLTSAGLIGVALAFGAQNLLRDLIAGTFIIFEDQLGVGDVVDLGIAMGTVEEVSLRTTRLRDVEGVVWHVPNGEIHRVGNKSQQWSRAVVDVPIAATANLDRAIAVIEKVADEMAREPEWRERILDKPDVWGVESFTLDAVTIRVVVKTAPSEQFRIGRELRGRIAQGLAAAGIASAPAGETPAT
ncbi:MAG TPA: mechanosensitive ion channel family protein [Acidimicrobiia bacterium]|jgi:small-conductance mechanosensitive channel|nr:mechanosensitive ion channel family protein [Acidimicrobiia bacterium]